MQIKIFSIFYLKKKIKTKKGKINFKDILCYLFNYLFIYLFIESSKQYVVSNYNFDNKININKLL